MRPRDSQRSKVYSAEKVLWEGYKNFSTVQDMEVYVHTCMEASSFKNKFNNLREVKIADGRGRRSACCVGTRGWSTLKMPRWARKESILLHELAHAVTNDKYAWHGPEFCNNYLFLVCTFMGVAAYTSLVESFKLKGVRFCV
jgi:putative metallohydrolase (TIGR04338 family)